MRTFARNYLKNSIVLSKIHRKINKAYFQEQKINKQTTEKKTLFKIFNQK